jgi:hypothetical protein
MPVTTSNASSLIGPTRFGAPTATNNLGGPFQGYSPQQTTRSYNNFGDVMTRTILRNSWNTPYAVGQINNYNRVITPFRAVNNSGDFLARINYSCGGPNQTNVNKPGRGSLIGSVPQQCDGTGVPASSCNPRFVADSSDYTRFRREQAANYNYNDLSPVGDANNGSFVALLGIRRR